MRHLKFGFVVIGTFFLISKTQASEVFSSADSMEAKSWSFSAFGSTSRLEPKVKVTNNGSVQVPTSGGSTSVFGTTNAEIKMEQESEQVVGLFEFQPHDGLKYRFKIGQVREFNLEFSSGSQTNKLETTGSGFVWGVGIGGSLAPSSIVSLGIRWDVAYAQTNVNLDRLQGGPAAYAVDQDFRQEEIQGSLTLSRRWKMVEPYGGVKVFHLMNRLVDNGTKEKIKGTNDEVSPFVGLQWMVAEKDSLVIEGSFVGEKSLSAGFKAQF